MDSEIMAIDGGPHPAAGPLLTAMLQLNTAHEVALSPLDASALAHLVGQAFAAFRVGTVDAFLIALDQDAEYHSPNFLWFRDRRARFV